MLDWNTNLKESPTDGPFLLKVNEGLFSGGWCFYKALRIRDAFFNADTKKKIQDPHSWAKVNM